MAVLHVGYFGEQAPDSEGNGGTELSFISFGMGIWTTLPDPPGVADGIRLPPPLRTLPPERTQGQSQAATSDKLVVGQNDLVDNM